MAKKAAVKAVKEVKVVKPVEKQIDAAHLEALRLAVAFPDQADMTIKRAGEYLRFLKGEQ